MVPKPMNKVDKQQKKEKKKNYDKLRREIMKQDPQKILEMQLKEREKYKKKKEKGQVKLVQDMSEREKRAERKKWRGRSHAYLKRKKEKQQQDIQFITENTSPSSSALISTPPSSQKQNGRKRVRRAQTQTARENQRLKDENLKLRRNNEAIRKSLKRMQNAKEKSIDPTSPRKVVRNLMESKDYNAIRKHLLEGEVLTRQMNENFKRVKSKKAKRFIANVIMQDNHLLKKYGLLTKYNFLSPRILEKRIRHSSSNNTRDMIVRKITHKIKSDVEKFLENDENSRCLAGKKDCITLKKVKKQKRILLADLNVLYEKFLRDKQYKISYTSFCRLRPFWVVKLDVSKRETCQCQKCDNFELMLISLHQNKVIESPAFQRYIEQSCCIPNTANCLHQRCHFCKDKKVSFNNFDENQIVTFQQWGKTKIQYKDHKTKRPKETTRLVKQSLQMSLKDLVIEVERKTTAFFEHQGNILRQYSAIKELKMTLGKGHVLIHCDFSENYCTKYASEVQAIHFGGNRSQISLHTVVMYYRTDEFSPESHTSFCTISKNLDHGPAAVWAHLQPIFSYINKNFHPVTSIHFLTDGPSSQYKNKSMFYFFEHKLKEEFARLKFATWNFHEAGHGKGAVDGIGATVKRTADRAVAQGKDIGDVESFIQILSDKIRTTKLLVVDNDSIENMTRSIQSMELSPFKGTMQVHQVVWTEGTTDLHMNKLSCFSCSRDCKKFMMGTHTSLNVDITHSKGFSVQATSQKPRKRLGIQPPKTSAVKKIKRSTLDENSIPSASKAPFKTITKTGLSCSSSPKSELNSKNPFLDMHAHTKNVPQQSPLENLTSQVLNVAFKNVILNDEESNMTMNVSSCDNNSTIVSERTLSYDDSECKSKLDSSEQRTLFLITGLCYKCGGAVSSTRPGISCDICDEIVYHKQCAFKIGDDVNNFSDVFCCAKCYAFSQDV